MFFGLAFGLFLLWLAQSETLFKAHSNPIPDLQVELPEIPSPHLFAKKELNLDAFAKSLNPDLSKSQNFQQKQDDKPGIEQKQQKKPITSENIEQNQTLKNESSLKKNSQAIKNLEQNQQPPNTNSVQPIPLLDKDAINSVVLQKLDLKKLKQQIEKEERNKHLAQRKQSLKLYQQIFGLIDEKPDPNQLKNDLKKKDSKEFNPSTNETKNENLQKHQQYKRQEFNSTKKQEVTSTISINKTQIVPKPEKIAQKKTNDIQQSMQLKKLNITTEKNLTSSKGAQEFIQQRVKNQSALTQNRQNNSSQTKKTPQKSSEQLKVGSRKDEQQQSYKQKYQKLLKQTEKHRISHLRQDHQKKSTEYNTKQQSTNLASKDSKPIETNQTGADEVLTFCIDLKKGIFIVGVLLILIPLYLSRKKRETRRNSIAESQKLPSEDDVD